jgi:hypothetical protein
MTTTPTNERGPRAASPGERPRVEEPNFRRAAERFMNDQDGQSMVEFALTGFLLLVLVLCIVQMSMNSDATHYCQLGNFYALRAGAVSWEYHEIGLDGFDDLRADMQSTARYFMFPAWYYEGEFLWSFWASQQIDFDPDPSNATNIVAEDDNNFIELSTNFDYYMTMPLARNVIGAAWVGSDSEPGYNIDEKIFANQRGSMYGQSGIFMVRDQDIFTGEVMNQINSALADANVPFTVGSMAEQVVTLQVSSDSRQPEGLNGVAEYTDSRGDNGVTNYHKMIIHQRRF